MEKSYYDADSLATILRLLEERYGVSSEDFYAAHLADAGLPEGLTGFNRHAWASFYREAQQLSGRSFSEHAERVLAPA
jgi:hypothetical protein